MLDVNWLTTAIAGLILADLGCRSVLMAYYRDGARILPLLRLAERSDRKVTYYKRFDSWLAPLPFVICWLEISLAALLARYGGSDWLWIAAALVIGGRFRALQEVGHNALHGALCPSKRLQWFLSNVFFQFPVFKRDMDSRYIVHVQEHHPNADIPGADPNLQRISAGGMNPGISSLAFVNALLMPIGPSGLRETIVTMVRAALFLNSNAQAAALRVVSVGLAAGLFYGLGGWRGILFGYLPALVVAYPLFAWLSLLAKHRWHVPVMPGVARGRDHDFEHGRATDYTGLSGAVVRYFICPSSDAYHLAHHLFPFVRAEYLPVVDRALKISEPRYTQYISNGLLFGRHGQPAALSELRERLTVAEHATVRGGAPA
jgi:fatty acid desaturase